MGRLSIEFVCLFVVFVCVFFSFVFSFLFFAAFASRVEDREMYG
jgi:hypothetical protein